MATVAQLQARLCDAEQAYANLIMGKNIQEGRHSVEQMQFTPADRNALISYISDLKGQLRQAGVQVSGGRIKARNIYHGGSV